MIIINEVQLTLDMTGVEIKRECISIKALGNKSIDVGTEEFLHLLAIMCQSSLTPQFKELQERERENASQN